MSAGVNIALALALDPMAWSAALSIYGIVSKLLLFAVTYLAIQAKGDRRAGRVCRRPNSEGGAA